MAGARIEDAIGATDGVNRLFKVSTPFVPGSTVVFLNGVAKVATLSDGWTEIGSDTIQMTLAPDSGDVVQIYYLLR
jgi:hypothetical protein